MKSRLRVALVVAGLVFLSAGAWMVAVPAGLAAVGVSCLVLEWLVGGWVEAVGASMFVMSG